jgi:DNA-binding transcriptional regulator GbsR (MarR family)
MQLFGVPRSVGQIYGLIYASPSPLCFSEIVARLDISTGSISQGLQFLRSLGAIYVVDSLQYIPERKNRSVTTAGHREYFQPELSLRRLVNGILHERVAPFAVMSAKRLSRLQQAIDDGDPGNGFYVERAERLNIWRRQLKTVVPILGALLGPVN